MSNKKSTSYFPQKLSSVFLLLILCTLGAYGSTAFKAADFTYKCIEIPAPSIGANMVNEAHSQNLYVFLPPSYNHDDSRRYPVLYFFIGYYMDEDIEYIRETLPEVMKEREFILVSVKDNNDMHGTFGMNSPVIGNWKDFFIQDVIPYVDEHFRTIATREARAVAGMSMGGHIALRTAFEHPELFNTMYALSPGVFDEHGLENAWNTWDQTFLNAYGAAVAPNPDKPFPHADIPTMDGSVEDMAARARWNKGFGELPKMVQEYLKQPFRVKNICIEVGTNDAYPWIPEGCVYLSKVLFDARVEHTFVLTDGGHDFYPDTFRKGMGPYVAKHLGE